VRFFVAEGEQVVHLGIQTQTRQRPRLSAELESCLLDVIGVQMRVAERVDEIAETQITDLRDHRREQLRSSRC